MSSFIPVDRQTAYLFPPSVKDWLPENHLGRFIVEVIERHVVTSQPTPTPTTTRWLALRHQQNLVIVGATGVGKTWLACVLGAQACRLNIPTVCCHASGVITKHRYMHQSGALFHRQLQHILDQNEWLTRRTAKLTPSFGCFIPLTASNIAGRIGDKEIGSVLGIDPVTRYGYLKSLRHG